MRLGGSRENGGASGEWVSATQSFLYQRHVDLNVRSRLWRMIGCCGGVRWVDQQVVRILREKLLKESITLWG